MINQCEKFVHNVLQQWPFEKNFMVSKLYIVEGVPSFDIIEKGTDLVMQYLQNDNSVGFFQLLSL